MNDNSHVYLKEGDHYISSQNLSGGKWEIETCIACGKPIEFFLKDEKYTPNHKCSIRAEGAKRGANTRGEEGFSRTPPYSERLADGFELMQNDDYEEGD